MQLEVGKKYRTRDGETIVEITENDRSNFYPVHATVIKCTSNKWDEGYSLLYETDGYFVHAEEINDDDLIEEINS